MAVAGQARVCVRARARNVACVRYVCGMCLVCVCACCVGPKEKLEGERGGSVGGEGAR